MLILIDNFDSFTYNIVQAFQILNIETKVFRNNAISPEEIFSLNPKYLVIGPGPGNPSQARISKVCIEKAFARSLPLLGICLGHQAIGEVFGSEIKRGKNVMHGKTSKIFHHEKDLFSCLPQGLLATRYHSLIVDRCPKGFEVSAWTDENEIMGLSHSTKPIYGVQFHPESIATEKGMQILHNFLSIAKNFIPFNHFS